MAASHPAPSLVPACVQPLARQHSDCGPVVVRSDNSNSPPESATAVGCPEVVAPADGESSPHH